MTFPMFLLIAIAVGIVIVAMFNVAAEGEKQVIEFPFQPVTTKRPSALAQRLDRMLPSLVPSRGPEEDERLRRRWLKLHH